MSEQMIGICPVCGGDIRLDPDGAYCPYCDVYFDNADLESEDTEYSDDSEMTRAIDEAMRLYWGGAGKYR